MPSGFKQNRPSKCITRPVKKAREQRRRLKLHHKRLIELGVSEESLRKLNKREVHAMLKRPVALKKKLAAAAG